MTLEEALALLEVELSADAQQLKRAYLRKVKRHKPDRDPEGFKRVREAYELVQQVGFTTGFTFVRRSEEAAVEPAVDSTEPESTPEPESPPSEQTAEIPQESTSGLPDPLAPSSTRHPPVDPVWRRAEATDAAEADPAEADADEELADESDTAWGGPDSDAESSWSEEADEEERPAWLAGREVPAALAPYLEQLEAIQADEPDEELGGWLDAIHEAPDELAVRWGLYEALGAAGLADEAVQLAVESHRAGFDDLLGQALVFKAEHLSEEALELAGQNEDRVMHWRLVHALHQREDTLAATRLAVELVQEAREQGEPTPEVGICIELVLECQRRAAPKAAEQLFEELRGWLRESGDEARFLSDRAHTWLLTRELVAISRGLPKSLRRGLAVSIREEDPAPARRAARRLSEQAAARVEEALDEDAPTLQQMLLGALTEQPALAEEPEQAEPRRWKLAGNLPWVVVAFALLMVMRMAGRGCDDHGRSVGSGRIPPTDIEEILAPPEKKIRREAGPEAGAAAKRVVDALGRKECTEAELAAQRLVQELGPRRTNRTNIDLTVAVLMLNEDFKEGCGDSSATLEAWRESREPPSMVDPSLSMGENDAQAAAPDAASTEDGGRGSGGER